MTNAFLFHCVAEMFEEMLSYGTSWGVINERELECIEAARTPEERIKHAAALAAIDAAHTLDYEVGKMFSYAQTCAARNVVRAPGTRQFTLKKVDRPCKWLYCDEGVPKVRNARGEMAAPIRRCITGAQCWGHEFVNPKTGQWERPHKCSHQHPGEPGWRVEWDADRTFEPMQPMQDGQTVWLSSRGAERVPQRQRAAATAW
jgi:hypothetical protein